MTATRRQAREWAIQMLTAADLNPPEDIDGFIDEAWGQIGSIGEEDGAVSVPKGKLRAFAEERVRGVWADREALDALIVPLLDHWDFDRLGTVERAVLRLGVWELKSTDVPRAVVINEAIDLTNWFASPKSRTLVNGVLDRYAKSLA